MIFCSYSQEFTDRIQNQWGGLPYQVRRLDSRLPSLLTPWPTSSYLAPLDIANIPNPANSPSAPCTLADSRTPPFHLHRIWSPASTLYWKRSPRLTRKEPLY